MSTVTRHNNTCVVVQEKTGRKAEAEVMAFNEGRNLTVVMNKSVKMLMNWNGRVYEGRMAGLDFISNGPDLTRTKTGIRG
jgi:hypothetical protein